MLGEALAMLNGPMLSGGLGGGGAGETSSAEATVTTQAGAGAWNVAFTDKETNWIWIAALLVVIYLFVVKGK